MPPLQDSLRDPLRFERVFKSPTWGGRALERAPGIALPPGVAVGESWEVVDRDGEDNSVVAEGRHAGTRLRSLMEAFRADLLGRAASAADGRFPLLVKYIDACQDLSVQVHPTDECAERMGAPCEGKTEAWYVLAARPGAVLYAGLKPGVDAATLEREGAGPGVVELLQRWEVRAGDCVLVPGGTVHAIGAGVTILEVQQNSDTTFRFYDWGRDRPTQPGRALEATVLGLPPRPPLRPVWEEAGRHLRRAPLARSRYFGLNVLEVSGSTRFSTGRQFQIYCATSGSGTLRMKDSGACMRVSPGDTWLVPSAAGFHYFEPAGGPLTLVQLLALP